jgi:DNA-binding transcriptional ArsR family regulator
MKTEDTMYYGMGMTELRPVPPKIRRAAKTLKAINHKLRQRMIDLLREKGEMSVTDIYIRLRLEQSVASQHLALLRREGVVNTSRNGKSVLYSINEERIQSILKCCSVLAS